MNTCRLWLPGVAGLAAAIVICCVTLSAGEPPQPPPVQYEKAVRQVAVSKNGEIKESSGLACSRIVPGVFYTHNDSGDVPRLFAISDKGEDLATIPIAGAQAHDWEDICSFTKSGKHYLLIGDVGDNRINRPSYQLYLVEEVAGRPKKGSTEPTIAGLRPRGRTEFRYEDGPHNCESIAYDPSSDAVILVEKVPGSAVGGPVRVYTLPLGARTAVARKIAAIPKLPSTATGMDISPDGHRAVITTNIDLIFFERKEGEKWGEVFSRGGHAVRAPHGHGKGIHGEAVCYGPDGRSVFMTIEEPPCTITELPVTAASEKAWNAYEAQLAQAPAATGGAAQPADAGAGRHATPRIWSDTTGQFKVKATLVKVHDGKVRLLRADNGETIEVPLEKLGAADQAYLRRQAEK